ncbi:ABATE domain-containing protein [Actinocrispum sp. NPDC049592]|uniref:CGNR zinc finger domain-containing protein n=1 Tax=Actinocrispum sp. NPDC049592 TaxID=3154835 RepID=UPI0034429E03
MSDPRFRLTGGRVCLDLVATLGRRHAPEQVERVPDEATFADWLVAAGLATSPPDVRPEDLGAARELREAVHRLVRAAMTGGEFDPADTARINAAATHPDLAPQLAGPGRLVLGPAARPVEAALATIARDAVHLLSGPRTNRIKECEHPDCSLLFFDDSPPGRRRWCSMDRCGNLVKIAGYRSRR